MTSFQNSLRNDRPSSESSTQNLIAARHTSHQSFSFVFVLMVSMFAALVPSAAFADGVVAGAPAKTSPTDRANADLASGRELYQSGNWYTAQEAFQNAYVEAPENSPTKAEATFELAGVLWEQGDYAAAYKKVQEAISRAEKLGLSKAIPALLLRKGHIEAARGNFSTAYSTFEKCLDAASNTGDDATAPLCRIAKRAVLTAQGKNPGSEAAYQQDLNALKLSKNPELVGVSIAKIAELQENLGNYDTALALLQQAQAEFERSKSVPAIARNKQKIAAIFQSLNRWNDSKKELDGVELTFRNMNNKPALVTTYNLIAAVKEHDGDAKAAYENLQKALHYAAVIASPHLQAMTRLSICEFFARTMSPERGVLDCIAARSVFLKHDLKTLATRAIVAQSRIEQAAGKYKDAEADYKQSIKELSKLPKKGDIQQEVRQQKANLCVVSSQIDSPDTLNNCTDALKTLDEKPEKTSLNRQMLVQVLLRVALAEQDAKQADQAIAHLERLVAVADIKEDNIVLANALLTLANLTQDADSTKQIKYLNDAVKLIDANTAALTPGTPAAELNLNIKTALAQALVGAKHWDDAIVAFKKVAKVAEKFEDWDRVAWSYLGQARSYQELKKPDEAKKAVDAGRPFAEKSKDKSLIQEFNKI